MSVSSSDGSHSIMSASIPSSIAVLQHNVGSKPRSNGDKPRDNPSKMTFNVPGTCTVSTTVALRWIEMVVNTMFARRASVELTLPALAQARELMLSPCN